VNLCNVGELYALCLCTSNCCSVSVGTMVHLLMQHGPPCRAYPIGSSTSRRPLNCAAALYRPSKQRSVSVGATSEGSDAVPLPPKGDQPRQQPQLNPSLLDSLIDQGVNAPVRWYQSALDRNPFLTKAMTSCVGFILGDLIAQASSSTTAGQVAITSRASSPKLASSFIISISLVCWPSEQRCDWF